MYEARCTKKAYSHRTLYCIHFVPRTSNFVLTYASGFFNQFIIVEATILYAGLFLFVTSNIIIMKKLLLATLIIPVLFAFISVNLTPVDNDGAVTFIIKNFGINTKGSLNGLKGTIKWDAANPAASQINASVDVNTINTNSDMRDKDIKEEKYFNYPKYPTINFVSTAVSATSVTGNLTIKGVTKSITFPITVTPSGQGYLFQGNFTINRNDFGVGGGSMVLSDKVDVTLKVQTTP